MSDCLFCKIIEGEIPSTKVYEDEKILAFKDINPSAPVHILVIPKKHIESIQDIQEEDMALMGYLHLKIKDIAKSLGVDTEGYRIISNVGENGGQLVQHLHFHLLGGKKLGDKLV